MARSLAFLALLAILSCCEGQGRKLEKDGKLLIPVQYLQVTTNTVFQIVSSTVFPFCITGTFALAPACTPGKRRRRSLPINADLVDQERDVGLMSSQDKDAKKEEKLTDKEKFFRFTIWNTASFTTSITLLFTNQGSSISLSYICYAPRMSLPPACG